MNGRDLFKRVHQNSTNVIPGKRAKQTEVLYVENLFIFNRETVKIMP